MTSPSGEGPPAPRPPQCPVCGAAIAGDPRLCARCDTPHHADCWGYTGRCAVYACMNTTVKGDLPVPVSPVPPLAVPDGPALPSLAASAERVAPIVPVAGTGALSWTADASGAWFGPRDGSITPAAGERIVMLPAPFRRDLCHPDDRAAEYRRVVVGLLATIAAVQLGIGMAVFPGLAYLKLLCALAASVAVAAFRGGVTPPQLAWLSVNAKGTWVHAITGGRPWEYQVEGATAPRRVRLERSYETCATDVSRTLLTYRLVLQWELGNERGDPRLGSRPLAPDLQMPETAEERRPVLEQLVARRALGQHIAATLSIPFEEGVRPS